MLLTHRKLLQLRFLCQKRTSLLSQQAREFLGDRGHRAYYLRRPFQRKPDCGVTSVNYEFSALIACPERANWH
jgi:hypothetical protein